MFDGGLPKIDGDVLYYFKPVVCGVGAIVGRTQDGRLYTRFGDSDATPERDSKGFSKWTYNRRHLFGGVQAGDEVFGVWVGPGTTTRDVATNALPERVFVISAVNHEGNAIVSTYDIRDYIGVSHQSVYVSPTLGIVMIKDLTNLSYLVGVWAEMVAKTCPVAQHLAGVRGAGGGALALPYGKTWTECIGYRLEAA